MDAGQVLQQGPPAAIHRSPRNARVADLVGIQNRFHGQWVGRSGEPGWGRLRWTGEGSGTDGAPLLRVRDKGKIEAGSAVSWVIPGDGIALLERRTGARDEFDVAVAEARHLGEITLATLAVTGLAETSLRVTLTGPQRLRIVRGESLAVRIDPALVHVMPLRPR